MNLRLLSILTVLSCFTTPLAAQVTPPPVLDTTDPNLRLWLSSDDLVTAGLQDDDQVLLWTDRSIWGTTFSPRTSTDPGGPFFGDPVEEHPHLAFADINGNDVPVVRFEREGGVFNLGNPAVDRSGAADRLYQTNNLEANLDFDPLNIGNGTDLTLFTVFYPNITTSLNEQGGPILGIQHVLGKRGTNESVYTLQIENRPNETAPLGSFLTVSYDAPTVYPTAGPQAEKTWHVTSLIIDDESGAEDPVFILTDASQDPAQRMTDQNVTPGNFANRNTSVPEPFGIGGTRKGAVAEGETFAGDIAEIIIFAKELTQQEFNDVETYLNDKYFATAPPGATGRDFLIIQRENPGNIAVWESLYGTGGGAAASVPEPASAVLAMLVCGAAALARRRSAT